MSCLGETLTALVDGELDHDERDRALAHLAGCPQCRAEADTLRRLKDRLRSLASPPEAVPDPDVPSADFLGRLYAMSEQPPPRRLIRPSVPAPARPRDNRPAARVTAFSVRPTGRPAALGPARLGPALAARRLPRRRYLAAGAAAAMVLGLGGASYALGGETGEPAVVPAFDRFEAEHALTNGVVPLSDVTQRP